VHDAHHENTDYQAADRLQNMGPSRDASAACYDAMGAGEHQSCLARDEALGAFKLSPSFEQILGCGVLDGTRSKTALPRGVGVPLAEIRASRAADRVVNKGEAGDPASQK
jgi:hypothetical protein